MIENKFADEMLTDDELDKVVGGNDKETSQIINLIGSVVQCTNRYGKYTRHLYDQEVAGYLKNHYNIEAYIHTGPLALNNYYELNGESITQDEVLDIIKSSK